MSADANLVKNAVEAVKKMQELGIRLARFDFMLNNVETPDGITRGQAEQDAKNKAEILTMRVEELMALYKKIDTSIFVKFPNFWLVEISTSITEHYGLLINLKNLYERKGYDKAIEILEYVHQGFFQKIAPKLGAMMMFDNDYQKAKDIVQTFSKEKEDFDTLKNSMTKEHESWRVENSKLNENLAKLTKKAFDVLDLVRDVSGETGAYKHAAFFKEQGKEHKTKQINWLWASGIMTAVLLIYLAGSYYLLPDVWKPIAISQGIIKAFGFSLLLSVLVFCIKNYKAHGHNHIVNTHRANSLKTYRAIVEGASSPDAQDIILANAAQHIFTPLDTGYVKGADSIGNPTVEVIRNVVNKGADSVGNPVVETIRNVVKLGDGKE